MEQINKIPEAIEQDFWLQKMSDKFGVQTELLRQTMKNLGKIKNVRQKSEELPNNKNVSELFFNRSKSLEELFFVMLLKNLKFFPEISNKMEEKYITFPEFRKLYEIIKRSYNDKDNFKMANIQDIWIQENQTDLVDLLLMKSENEFEEKESKEIKIDFLKTFEEMQKEWLKNEKDKVKSLMNEAQQKGDTEGLEKYFTELSELNKIKI